jgi:hypothetical protein
MGYAYVPILAKVSVTSLASSADLIQRHTHPPRLRYNAFCSCMVERWSEGPDRDPRPRYQGASAWPSRVRPSAHRCSGAVMRSEKDKMLAGERDDPLDPQHTAS